MNADRTPRVRPGVILARVLLPAVLLVSGGCASPLAGVWPPAPGERSHRVVVSTDRWHSTVGVWAASDPDGLDPADLEEWGYAERGYYLEGETGCSGTSRALLVPSAGVVIVARAGRPFAERTVQPPGRVWEFRVGDEGMRRMLEFLESERVGAAVLARHGRTTWHPATSAYHAFHHCHHFTAGALRAAGLPVRGGLLALFKWSLEAQLDRAAGMALAAEQAE